MSSDFGLKVAENIKNAGIPIELVIIIIAMVPLIELRGAIPIAIYMGLTPFQVIFYSLLGSCLVIPILLLLLKPVLRLLKKIKFFNSLALGVESLFSEKASKISNKIDKNKGADYIIRKELTALSCFVAVPLPVTGTWSGSAIAVFLNLSFFKSLIVIVIGNVFACLIMTLLSYCFQAYITYILLGLFIFVFVLIMVFVLKKVKNRNRNINQELFEDDFDIEVVSDEEI